MRETPKFDKKKCAKCRYRGNGEPAYFTRVGTRSLRIYCDYLGITGETCLKRGKHGDVYDIRGEDYDDCKCFVEGETKKEKCQVTIIS